MPDIFFFFFIIKEKNQKEKNQKEKNQKKKRVTMLTRSIKKIFGVDCDYNDIQSNRAGQVWCQPQR